MREGYGSEIFTDPENVDRAKQQMPKQIEEMKRDSRLSPLISSARKIMFKGHVVIPIDVPCDLKKKYKSGQLRINIAYEEHNTIGGNKSKSALLARTQNENLRIFWESDLSKRKETSESDRNIIDRGVSRSFGKFVKDSTDFSKIVPIDDELMRAAAIPSLPADDIEGFISEAYRNPTARKIIESMAAQSKSPKIKQEAIKIKSVFREMNLNPRFPINEIEWKFNLLRSHLNSTIDKELRPLVKIRQEYFPLSIDLRDESMSRSIVQSLCSEPFTGNEIHIVVGAHHAKGIEDRLRKALTDVMPTFVETNLVRDGNRAHLKDFMLRNSELKNLKLNPEGIR